MLKCDDIQCNLSLLEQFLSGCMFKIYGTFLSIFSKFNIKIKLALAKHIIYKSCVMIQHSKSII